MDEVYVVLIMEHGYTLLFLLLVIGIIGFPIPDEGILLLAGALIGKSVLRFDTTCVISFLAVLSGSLVNYTIARWFGAEVFTHWIKRRKWLFRRYVKTLRLIKKYGAFSIQISYFLPGVRMGVSYGAGLLRLPFGQFVSCSIIGIALWVGVYLYIGKFVGTALLP